LLDRIVEVARELTRSEVASILLFDPDTRGSLFEAAPGMNRDELREISVPLDSSVADWIFTNSKLMVIQDARNDPRTCDVSAGVYPT